MKIALVGRPNVGKSALFNRIVKKKIAIVDSSEGVTRDRLYGKTELFNTPFELIDTGGIDPHSALPFQEGVRKQTLFAIEEADALIMVVDAQVGITALDEMVAKLLKPLKKPVCLAVNKMDAPNQEWLIAPFYALGIEEIIPVSASHGSNIAELLQRIISSKKPIQDKEEVSDALNIALIGRTNVGKSTLLNRLLGEERSLVSPQAGTTRDAIDTKLKVDDTLFRLIDTAGIRRKKGEKEVVDKYAAIRTKRAIERSDICLLLLDASSGLTTQEKRILSMIEEEGKGCLILFNKWDLISGCRMEHYLKELQHQVPFIRHCPTLFGSAKTGKNLHSLFPALKEVAKARKLRIGTGELNAFIARVTQLKPPPMHNGKRLRIYYLTQVESSPPRFILFVNSPSRMSLTYKKYLVNQLRARYPFTGTPLIFHLKRKEAQKQKEHKQEPLPTLNLEEIVLEETAIT